jgi:hypothetical protein
MLPRVTPPATLPRKPFALRALNRAGSALGSLGLALPSLDPDALCRTATQRTGLADFGDDGFREGLARLVAAFEREANLTLFGRFIARADLLRLLQNRLRMEATLRAHPEIERGAIAAPIFVIGLPRTGTTILHELLALDPALRAPMTWETMYAWPPPERASFETDPRIAQVEKHLAGTERVMPGFQSMHRMGASLPQECVALTSHEFRSILFTTTHKVDSYQRWLETLDHRRIYAAHKRWLQYLQWKAPATCWALKSPAHIWTLDALLAVYPDARIVQTHRDPLRVLASLASLCTLLRSMASDAIDPAAIGAEWAPRLAEGLEASMRARDAAKLPDDRVFDLHFQRFLGNEIETIQAMYERFGMRLSPEAETRMRRYLADNPKDKHGGHLYDFGSAGLDAATERRRYAAYVDRYAIPSE